MLTSLDLINYRGTTLYIFSYSHPYINSRSIPTNRTALHFSNLESHLNSTNLSSSPFNLYIQSLAAIPFLRSSISESAVLYLISSAFHITSLPSSSLLINYQACRHPIPFHFDFKSTINHFKSITTFFTFVPLTTS